MAVFRIPSSPAELLTSSDESALTVVQDIAVAELKAEEIQEFAEGTATDLICKMDFSLTHVCATMSTPV